MSIFRDDCIFHGQLLADFAKQFPAKTQETAEDRWEFDQQSEALYQARLEAIKPPLNPAALDGQDAPLTPEQSSVTDLPFVSQIDEE